MELNPLAREILKLLSESEEPLLARQMAERLGVSTRMVQYHIHQAEEWLSKQGVALIVKPNYGYSMRLDQKKRGALRLLIDRIPSEIYHLSAQDRVNILLFIFLTSDEPVVLKQLERQLGVSKATLIKDMDEAELHLSRETLSLVRKPGFGYQLAGSEEFLREAVVNYLIDLVGVLPLVMLCRQASWTNISIGLHSPLQEMIIEYLDHLNLSVAWHISKELVEEYSLDFPDQSFISLVLTLALQVQRMRDQHFVHLPVDPTVSDLTQDERLLTKLIAKKVAFHHSIILPEDEEKYLARVMMSSEWISTKRISDADFVDNQELAFAQLLTNMVLTEAASQLHPVLQVEPKLRLELYWAIYRMMRRARFGLPFHQDLPAAIPHQYRHVEEVARKIAAMLEKHIGNKLTHDDVAMLTTYFLSALERIYPFNRRKKVVVICDTGFAFASLMRSRFSREFPDLDLVGQMGIVQFLEASPQSIQADLIISTLPIPQRNIPVIVVKPTLTDKNIVEIHEILQSMPGRTALDTSTSALRMVDLLTPDTIVLDHPAKTWQEAVKTAGQLLVNARAVTNDYIAAMAQIIEDYGPYMVSGRGIALLHARPDQGVQRLAMGFIRFQPPVVFGHPENDPVDMAFVLATPDEYSHLGALENYIELLSRNELQEQLRKAQSKTEVFNILNAIGGAPLDRDQ